MDVFDVLLLIVLRIYDSIGLKQILHFFFYFWTPIAYLNVVFNWFWGGWLKF